MTSHEQLISHADAAAYLGITAQGLYAMRHKGTAPPAYRIGSRLKYRRSDIDAWLEQRREGNA